MRRRRCGICWWITSWCCRYGKNIRILTTSADVIHSFFIPSLGVQRYAIPGPHDRDLGAGGSRRAIITVNATRFCGMNHSDMPISVHAVSPDDFKTWLDQQKANEQQRQPRMRQLIVALASEH